MAQRNTFRDDEDLEEKINMRDLARVGVYLKPYMARVVWILIVVAAMGCINVVEPYLTKIMIDSVIPAKNLALLGIITNEQKRTVDEYAIKLRQAKYYLSEKGHDLTEALAIARRYVQTFGVEIIYVDYLQLQYVTDRRTETRSRELGTISKSWKEFSQDADVPVVLISQLGRQALDSKTAEAEHGYGSYEVAQDADNYLTLKDKSADEIAEAGIEKGNKIMNISKNRMGEKSVLIDIYSGGANYRMMEV